MHRTANAVAIAVARSRGLPARAGCAHLPLQVWWRASRPCSVALSTAALSSSPPPAPPTPAHGAAATATNAFAAEEATPQRVRGMHDHLAPDEVRRRQTIRRAFVDAAEAYSFQEVETPVVEDTALFLLGDASDVVGKEMYTFLDRSKSSLSLRPEGTAGVMRAVMAEGGVGGGGGGSSGGAFGPQQPPRKLYYEGPMFRHERPQRGRYRQFTQLGVEYVGGAADTPLADAEVITLARHFLQGLGIADRCTLRINTLGSAACRRRYTRALAAHFAGLPAGDDAGGLSQGSLDKLATGRVLRILDSKDPADRAAVAAAPVIEEFLVPAARDRHRALLGLLDAAGVPYVQDWHLVRGLDYYCHAAFEFVYDGDEGGSGGEDEGKGGEHGAALGVAQGTVLAGGRYDALATFLGWGAGAKKKKRGGRRNQQRNHPDSGPAAGDEGGNHSVEDSGIPAVGWAAGMERLQLVLPAARLERAAPPPVAAVAFLRTAGCPTIHDDPAVAAAFHGLCAALQEQALTPAPAPAASLSLSSTTLSSGSSGFRLHRHYAAGKMPQLLRACEGVGARVLLLAGADELAGGQVTVRNLDTREQRTVPVAEAGDCVREALRE